MNSTSWKLYKSLLQLFVLICSSHEIVADGIRESIYISALASIFKYLSAVPCRNAEARAEHTLLPWFCAKEIYANGSFLVIFAVDTLSTLPK